jgi:hypothetical protein
MKSFCVGVFVSTLVLFLWGWLAVAYLPMHEGAIQPLPDEVAVRSELISQQLESGVYFFPAPLELYEGYKEFSEESLNNRQKEIAEMERTGPSGYVIFRAEPGGMRTSMMLSNGFFLNFLGVLIVAIMLQCSLKTCRWYIQRVVFVAMFGVFLMVMMHAHNWNWMRFSTDYTFAMIADNLIGWVIVGVVLGAFIKPRQAEESSGEVHG